MSVKHHANNNYLEGERSNKHMVIPPNVIDKKARLKTSQGTKSGNGGISSKLPLMHNTLDNPNNHLAFMKSAK